MGIKIAYPYAIIHLEFYTDHGIKCKKDPKPSRLVKLPDLYSVQI